MRLDADAVLPRLGDDQAEPAPAVGLGLEDRLATPELGGSVLVAQERVVHLLEFPGVGADHDVNQ